jgi:hypothetical protein
LKIASSFLILPKVLPTSSIPHPAKNLNGKDCFFVATNTLSHYQKLLMQYGVTMQLSAAMALPRNDHGTYSFVILIDTHTDSPQMAI